MYTLPERDIWAINIFHSWPRSDRVSGSVRDRLRKIAVNCDWDSFTPEQLLRDHLVTGIQETKFGQVCPQLKVSSEDYKITSNTVVFL